MFELFFFSFLVALAIVSGTLKSHVEMANSLDHFFAFVMATKPLVGVSSNSDFVSEK